MAKNAELAGMACYFKKHGKIESTWTRNCVFFIKTKGLTPEDENIKVLKEKSDLRPFKGAISGFGKSKFLI